MNNIYNFLSQALGFQDIKPEGSQYVVTCPECGKTKHFYIDKATGLGYCHVCNFKANPYLLARKILGIGQVAAMQLIARHGLAADHSPARAARPPSDKLPKFEDLRELTGTELREFCTVKQISEAALLKFEPRYFKRNNQDCVVLAGWDGVWLCQQ